MKKIIFITVSAVICILTISSCQKPANDGIVADGILIYVTDKNGNDLLTTANPNSIADKLIVTYKGKTFKNMHPTDQGADIPWPDKPGAYIASSRTPNVLGIATGYYAYNYPDRFSWEKGEEIVITMPDGTKHIISYIGKDNPPSSAIAWLFDGSEKFYGDYTIVYDPEEQK